jgi:hypothetical protein
MICEILLINMFTNKKENIINSKKIHVFFDNPELR